MPLHYKHREKMEMLLAKPDRTPEEDAELLAIQEKDTESEKPQEISQNETQVMSAAQYDEHTMKGLEKSDPRKFIRITIERQPKVMTMIPTDIGEKTGTMQRFSISEVDFDYPKGEFVEVPQAIAEMVKERWYPHGEKNPLNLRNASQATMDALNS